MKKKLLGGLVGVCILGAAISSVTSKDIESINISIDDYQDEYDINTDIPVIISTEPENAKPSDLQYETDSSYISFSENGVDTGTHEGTYEIYVTSGDIQSNTLSIHVVDITAREEAEAKAAEEAEKQRLEEEKAAQEAEEQRLEEEKAAQEAEEQRLEEEKAAQETEAQQLSEEQTATEESTVQNNSSENGSNFNTYDNAEQQQTSASYVLNTNTHKFHYPGCKSVKKISPENYSTSNSSRDELISQGYDPCGNCKP
jgi:hypothetical protein